MKRLLLAAGLSVAALTVPATAALADGYVTRPHAKPKPKAHAKAKPSKQVHRQHARAPHAPYQGHVRDYGALYGARSYASVSLEQYERTETSTYEERDGRSYGPVVTYSEQTIAPHRGCYPQAPCGYAWSNAHPGAGYPQPQAHVGSEFHHGALAGGVGYGVDGGPIWSGPSVVFVPRVGVPPAYGYGQAQGYYGGYSHPQPRWSHPGHGAPHGHKHPGRR